MEKSSFFTHIIAQNVKIDRITTEGDLLGVTAESIDIKKYPIYDSLSTPWLKEPGHNEESWESKINHSQEVLDDSLEIIKIAHTDGIIFQNGKAIAIQEMKTDKTGCNGHMNRYKCLLQLIAGYYRVDEEIRKTIRIFNILTPKYVCYIPITEEIKTMMETINEVITAHYPNISPSKTWAISELKDLIQELPVHVFKYFSTKEITLFDFINLSLK